MLLIPGSQSGSVEFVESRGIILIKFKMLARYVTWSIPMERLESTANVKCDFLVRQMADLNARLLDNTSEDLAARVAKIEKLLGIETPVQSHVFRAFTLPDYTLSEDRKTVSKNAGTNSHYQAFISEQPLTAKNNTFSVLLNSFGTGINGHLIGVAKRDTNLRGGLHKTVGAYLVYLPKILRYSFYKDGHQISGQDNAMAHDGSRLTLRFEPTTSRLSFELDGTALLPTMKITGTNAAQLFPIVDLFSAEQSVSFE